MDYIRGASRNQVVLFPETVEDYITEDNPVRFIDAFAASLDLAALGFTHATPAETGRPAYDPGDLLRLYLYGYLNRVRSSRMLEREAKVNLEVMWLLGKLRPDFKTIAGLSPRQSGGHQRRLSGVHAAVPEAEVVWGRVGGHRREQVQGGK